MNTNRDCGCKSYRTCFICEKQFNLTKADSTLERVQASERSFLYSPDVDKILRVGDTSSNFLDFPGIRVFTDFVSKEEEAQLMSDVDRLPWDSSQSGRRKQNFGPRANFKRRKVKAGAAFVGFPATTRFVQERFAARVPCLRHFYPVEQCSIEYRPETGACIEPHIDDCWIWGERIVQLNLLSDSTLTCLPYLGGNDRYNLADVATFPRVLDDDANFLQSSSKPFQSPGLGRGDLSDAVIHVPLPRRSLLVMFGQARYDWEHCILRKDIVNRRVVIAYRELTPPYLPGGDKESEGSEILRRAEAFWEH